MGYTITSKSQIIDVAAIEKGCQQILDAANEFTTHATNLNKIAQDAGPEVLSADKETINDDIEQIAIQVGKYEGIVSGMVSAIITEANYIWAQQQRAYQNYLASLEKDE